MRSVMICVDDDKYMLHALSDQLNAWFGENYIVEKALSGEEGLMIIDEYKEKNMNVSVVISDYIMPVMRGDQFLEKVREKDNGIKKIMLTGYAALDGVINAINKAGLYRFIAKPWDNKDLMLTILEAVKSYEQDQTMLRLSVDYKNMFDRYNGRIKDMQSCYDTTLASLISAMEDRFDNNTHSLAVRHYSVGISKALKMTKDEQHLIGCVALLHETGKLNFSSNELNELEQARRAVDYSLPIVKKLHEQTMSLVSRISDKKLADMLNDQYKMFSPDLPQHSRILTIADMFDNILSVENSPQSAYARLLKCADSGFVDPQLTKMLIQNTPLYRGLETTADSL